MFRHVRSGMAHMISSCTFLSWSLGSRSLALIEGILEVVVLHTTCSKILVAKACTEAPKPCRPNPWTCCPVLRTMIEFFLSPTRVFKNPSIAPWISVFHNGGCKVVIGFRKSSLSVLFIQCPCTWPPVYHMYVIFNFFASSV